MCMAIVGVDNGLKYASTYEKTEVLYIYIYICIQVYRYALVEGSKWVV
jgi:hypothetical protein